MVSQRDRAPRQSRPAVKPDRRPPAATRVRRGRDRSQTGRAGGGPDRHDAPTALVEMPARAFEAMSRAFGSAISLVEQQLDLGITLATVAERMLVDVEDLRSAAPGALRQQIRANVHAMLGLLVDVVTLATTSLGEQARGLVTITTRTRSPADRLHQASTDRADDEPALVVQMPGPLAVGQAAERPLELINDTDRATSGIQLSSSDLVGPSGARIPGAHVSFDPPSLSVAAQRSGRVVVRVVVPGGLPDGAYEGRLDGVRLDGPQARLRVDVASSEDSQPVLANARAQRSRSNPSFDGRSMP